MELIIGIVSVILFFILTHLGMLLYYKPFRYWQYYNCELQKKRDDNKKSYWLYTFGYLFFAIGILPFWLNISKYVRLYTSEIMICGIMASTFFVLQTLFRFENHPKIHGFSLTSSIICLFIAIRFLYESLHLVLIEIYYISTILFFGIIFFTALATKIDKFKRKTVDNISQKLYILFLDIFFVSLLSYLAF